MSRAVIEAALGKRPEHLRYPVGDRTSAGPREFAHRGRAWLQDRGDDAAGRAVSRARAHLTALPRISLNGEYQQPRYAKVLLSGVGDRDVERLPRRRRGVSGAETGNERSNAIACIRFDRTSSVAALRRLPAAHPAHQRHRRQRPIRARRSTSRAWRRGRLSRMAANCANAIASSAHTTTSTSSAMVPMNLRSLMRHGGGAITGDIARHCRTRGSGVIWCPPSSMTGRE